MKGCRSQGRLASAPFRPRSPRSLSGLAGSRRVGTKRDRLGLVRRAAFLNVMPVNRRLGPEPCRKPPRPRVTKRPFRRMIAAAGPMTGAGARSGRGGSRRHRKARSSDAMPPKATPPVSRSRPCRRAFRCTVSPQRRLQGVKGRIPLAGRDEGWGRRARAPAQPKTAPPQRASPLPGGRGVGVRACPLREKHRRW